MFAYILRAPNGDISDEAAAAFFERFKATPGLLHAYSLRAVEDVTDSPVVAIWESREAAEKYLESSPLRKEVDAAAPQATRIFYEVLGSD